MDRAMMPVPSPFGPPPMGGAMMGGMDPMGGMAPKTADPLAVLAAIRALSPAVIKPPEPIYRPGYQPPKKKAPEVVRANAKRLYDANRLWRNLVYTTLMWVHQDLTGMFPEDEKERLLGFQEGYISSALSDERNLMIGRGAGLQPSFKAQWQRDELRGYAQRLEDFVHWLREHERFQHSDGGNRPLELDEWALFTDYGMYVSRDTFAPERTDCPVDMRLIDPAQVHPIWDRRDGLKEVYRVFWDTTEEITAAYGDLPPSALAKLKNQLGEIGDETELEVIEYWDTWYRQVHVGGELVLSTAHEYGDVPYTIQYGGHGDPMFTRTPSTWRENGRWATGTTSWGSERIHKAVPYLYYRLKGHEIYEAVMARILTGFKKDINPPTIRYRSDAAAEKPMPQLDASPGAQNEAMLGEEKIEALPTVNLATTNLVLAQLTQDRMTGSAPPEAYGRVTKSNTSSIAQAAANDAGMHLLLPDTKAWEAGLARRYDRVARMVANFGHLATYGGDEPKPLLVPVKRPKAGQPKAYEFDRDVIEKVGSRVTVTFTNVDPRDWAGLAAAGKNMVDGGFALRREIRALATGDHDYDRFYEEWMEENALFGALQLPEFQKLNVLAQIAAEIKEADGNPAYQATLLKMLELWQQIAAPPQQPQQPGMCQPGMGGPQGPMPPQGGASPGVPGGMSYPAVGAGPGTQGAPVGRPQYGLQGEDVGP